MRVKERPILFSGPMVRAILDGRKTQTRRLVKNVPEDAHTFSRCEADGSWIIWCSRQANGTAHDYHNFTQRAYPRGGGVRCPFGRPGDRLWVRETFSLEDVRGVSYRATDKSPGLINWKPSIHMPRWASRLTLEITDVRVQRLQEISEEDAVAEGVGAVFVDTREFPIRNPRPLFALLWDQINGKRVSWESNPFVWALTFRRADREDACS